MFLFVAALLWLGSANAQIIIPAGSLTCSGVLEHNPYNHKRVVIVVDGYSSGAHFSQYIRRYKDVNVIHIHSAGKPPKPSYAATFDRNLYAADFAADAELFKKNPRAAIDKLIYEIERAGFTPVGVLTGADSGPQFADHLRTALHEKDPAIPSNGINEARKNKYLMAETLRSQGVDVVKQVASHDVEKILEWVRKNNLLLQGPKKIVVKPLADAGTTDLSICYTEDQIRAAVTKIIGKPNSFGVPNTDVLVQEFLEGEEYVVDTVSLSWFHKISEILHYNKTGAKMYDHDNLLPFEGTLQDTLVFYARMVLNGLGIHTGISHIEIMMVPGRGPVLVELNDRIIGSSVPLMVEAATGHSQLDLGVMALLDPQGFIKLPMGYELKKHGMMVNINNTRPKVNFNGDIIPEVQALPGVIRADFHFKADEPMGLTHNLGSSIAMVLLAHEDPAVLQQTLQTLQEWRDQGRFTKN